MKKLNAIFLILIFAMSMLVCSCSASAGVSLGKLQSTKAVKLSK